MAHTAYIALGSNLNDPAQQLRNALETLNAAAHCRLVAVSAFYQSSPLGPQDQPDFVNAVARVETTLTPFQLLDLLQEIEQKQGRVRLRRWGERTLDLDLLLFDNLMIYSQRLTVPHYAMTERQFVIQPLWEIAPHLRLPNGQRLADIQRKLGEDPSLRQLARSE